MSDKKRVYVMSRSTVHHNFSHPKASHVIISITDFQEPFTPYIDTQRTDCLGVLAMRFGDFESQADTQMPVFDEEKADLLASFIKVHWNSISFLGINCDAGLSRSAGVAEALITFFGLDAVEIFSYQQFKMPNSLVKNLLVKALQKHFAP